MSTIINANGSDTEARIAKALAHPLRARILQRLGEHAHVLAIAGESRARIDTAGGEGVRSTLAIQHFRRDEVSR